MKPVPKLSRSLSPPRTGLEPEYLRRHVAVPGRVEQKPRDLGVGLGLPRSPALPR